jgi:predicted ester cyclase
MTSENHGADRTRQVVERLVDAVWNARDESAAADLCVQPDEVLAWHRDRRAAFPDLTYEVVDLVLDGPRAALRWEAAGTQAGEFGPVPPTGRRASWSGATFLTVTEEGRAGEVWSVNELFQVLEQLGVEFVPPPSA